MTFTNLPILYQMKVGVLTRNGILLGSRPFLREGEVFKSLRIMDKEEVPFKRLEALIAKLILSDTGRRKQRLTYFEKKEIIEGINKLLQVSHKKPLMIYLYPNEGELIKT